MLCTALTDFYHTLITFCWCRPNYSTVTGTNHFLPAVIFLPTLCATTGNPIIGGSGFPISFVSANSRQLSASSPCIFLKKLQHLKQPRLLRSQAVWLSLEIAQLGR